MPADRSDAAAPPFRDRSRRLVLLGAISMLVGLGCAALAVLQAALPLAAGMLPEVGPPPDLASAIAGALVWLALAAVFVAVGWGSITRRRWTRPLMLTLAWTWLLGGVASLALVPVLVGVALGGELGADLPPEAGRLVLLMMLSVIAAGGVLLPAIFIAVYRDPDVERTCAAYDPRPAWTDRCPTRVLGLAVGLGACGVLMLPFAMKPAVPLFGLLVVGPAGTLLTLLGAAACVWSAWLLYRLRPAGWWAVTLLLVGLGLSTTVTLLVVEPHELLTAMGSPVEVATPPAGDGLARTAWVLASLGITLTTLVYLLRIRGLIDPLRRTDRHGSASSDDLRPSRRGDRPTSP